MVQHPNATIGNTQPFETQPAYGAWSTQINKDIKDSTKEVSDKDQRQKLNGAQRFGPQGEELTAR